jgi:hypothetical protein
MAKPHETQEKGGKMEEYRMEQEQNVPQSSKDETCTLSDCYSWLEDNMDDLLLKHPEWNNSFFQIKNSGKGFEACSLGRKPNFVHKEGVTSLILWVGDKEEPSWEEEEEYNPFPPILPEFVPKALKWYEEIYLEELSPDNDEKWISITENDSQFVVEELEIESVDELRVIANGTNALVLWRGDQSNQKAVANNTSFSSKGVHRINAIVSVDSSEILIPVLFDTGCSITILNGIYDLRLGENPHTFVLHKMNIPGGSRYVIRVYNGIRVAIAGQSYIELQCLSLMIDERLIYEIFQSNTLDVHDSAKEKLIPLQKLRRDKEFQTWLHKTFEIPSKSLQEKLLSMEIMPNERIGDNVCGLLGMDYIGSIYSLIKPRDENAESKLIVGGSFDEILKELNKMR